ncbi:MAG: TetR/AcrR family transcriptional regulator, partial [Bryobacteraceae bacterium]
PRRLPTQPRGERRVERLLDAAAFVIARDGYDAATMSAIAERAGASIGSLYQFFPNKLSIAQALRARYGSEFAELCVPLASAAKSLNPNEMAGHLIDLICQFAKHHPAFAALLDAPQSARSPAAIRQVLRERLAALFEARRPRISKSEAIHMAAVTLQIMKAFSRFYASQDRRERRWCAREFKLVLQHYLEARLQPRRNSIKGAF